MKELEILRAADRKALDTFLATRGPVSKRRSAAAEAWCVPPEILPSRATQLPDYVLSSPIGHCTYDFIWNRGRVCAYPTVISRQDIEEARGYASELLQLDLSSVQVSLIPDRDWDMPRSEGVHFDVASEEHVILVPTTVQMVPGDLLCHEFGHSCHAIARRKHACVSHYLADIVTAELVAHFTQYNYILSHLSIGHFASALGQLVTSSFALSIIATGESQDYEVFIEKAEAHAIREVWSADILREQFEKFRLDRNYLMSEAGRGISLILALILIDEHDSMRNFIGADRIDVSLETKLAAVFPKVNFESEFSQINAKVIELAQRFQ